MLDPGKMPGFFVRCVFTEAGKTRTISGRDSIQIVVIHYNQVDHNS